MVYLHEKSILTIIKIFLNNMNYEKLYDNLIQSRFSLKKEREILKKEGHYFEIHHIIPKCKGGTNDYDNLVILTAKEHFISHRILWVIYKDRQMALAYNRMLSCNKNQQRVYSSRQYQDAREAYRLTNLGNTFSKGLKRVKTQEQIEKHSKKMKGKFIGENNPFYGKKHSDETKNILSQKAKERKGCKSAGYKGKRVISKDGEIVGIFDTNEDVSNFLGSSISSIKNVLGGNQKTTKGHTIKYLMGFLIE